MFKLEDIIQSDENAPVYDSYLYDFKDKPIEGLNYLIKDIISHLDWRLGQLSIFKSKRFILCHKNIIGEIDEEIIEDEFCPSDTIYILTNKIGNREIIHPPFIESDDPSKANKYITWNEYFNRILKGEPTKLVCEYPFLQAKIYNIGVEDV